MTNNTSCKNVKKSGTKSNNPIRKNRGISAINKRICFVNIISYIYVNIYTNNYFKITGKDFKELVCITPNPNNDNNITKLDTETKVEYDEPFCSFIEHLYMLNHNNDFKHQELIHTLKVKYPYYSNKYKLEINDEIYSLDNSHLPKWRDLSDRQRIYLAVKYAMQNKEEYRFITLRLSKHIIDLCLKELDKTRTKRKTKSKRTIKKTKNNQDKQAIFNYIQRRIHTEFKRLGIPMNDLLLILVWDTKYGMFHLHGVISVQNEAQIKCLLKKILCHKADDKFFVDHKTIKMKSFFNNYAKKVTNYITKDCKNTNPAKYLSNGFREKTKDWYEFLRNKEKNLIAECSYEKLINIKATRGISSIKNYPIKGTAINDDSRKFWLQLN